MIYDYKYMKSKAVIFDSVLKQLTIKDILLRPLQNDEVYLKNKGFSINRADILDTKGGYYKLDDLTPLGIECVGQIYNHLDR